MDSIPSAAFRPRCEVGWVPGGRLSSVSVELNVVLLRFFASDFFVGRVRSSGMYIMFFRVFTRLGLEMRTKIRDLKMPKTV